VPPSFFPGEEELPQPEAATNTTGSKAKNLE
jgi:hypothetical protein